jgi:NAD+ diphosphatase
MEVKMIFKFCPDCGSGCKQLDFKTYKCPSCGHSFYDEPIMVVGGLIQNPQGKYLFVRRGIEPYKGTLGVPGGYLDNNETLEDGFRRESFEEAEVKISNIKYFSSFLTNTQLYGHTENIVVAHFTATTEDPGKCDNKEVMEILWLAKDEIDMTQVEIPDVKALLRDFLKK